MNSVCPSLLHLYMRFCKVPIIFASSLSPQPRNELLGRSGYTFSLLAFPFPRSSAQLPLSKYPESEAIHLGKGRKKKIESSLLAIISNLNLTNWHMPQGTNSIYNVIFKNDEKWWIHTCSKQQLNYLNRKKPRVGISALNLCCDLWQETHSTTWWIVATQATKREKWCRILYSTKK